MDSTAYRVVLKNNNSFKLIKNIINMTEEKYYKLTFHTKHSVGSFYLKSNGVIQMTNLSDTIKNSKLE